MRECPQPSSGTVPCQIAFSILFELFDSCIGSGDMEHGRTVRISAATELQSSLAQATGSPPLVLIVKYLRGFPTAFANFWTLRLLPQTLDANGFIETIYGEGLHLWDIRLETWLAKYTIGFQVVSSSMHNSPALLSCASNVFMFVSGTRPGTQSTWLQWALPNCPSCSSTSNCWRPG